MSGWLAIVGLGPGDARLVTPEAQAVMAEAIRLREEGAPVNLIFAHHPLIFSPLTSVAAGDPVGDMVRLAITHGIGVYSAHTNFDQVADGTADVLAQLLQLQNSIPVAPTQEGLGYGRVGDLPAPQSLDELLATIQAELNPPNLIHSPTTDLQQTIKRVAVLGGSGASFIGAVAKTGAQVYLTSDCKFHQFQEGRDRNLILIDAGLNAPERPACARLVEKFWQQGVVWTRLSTSDEDFRQFW